MRNCCLVFARLWGAHACNVLVKAFCLHELPNCFYGQTSYEKRKLRCRKMRQPERHRRRLPRLGTGSKPCTKSINRRSARPRAPRPELTLKFSTKSEIF